MIKNPIILQFQDISKTDILSAINSYIGRGFVIDSLGKLVIDLVAYEGRKDKDIIVIEERKTFASLNKSEQKPIGFIRLKEKGKLLPTVLEVEIFINNKIPYDFYGNTFLTQLAIKLGEKYKVIDPSVLPRSPSWAELEALAKSVKNKREAKKDIDDTDQNYQMHLQTMEQNMSEQNEQPTNINEKQKKEPTIRTQDRFKVFKQLKKDHPTWSQSQVAYEANRINEKNEIKEIVTESTVRNTYRSMGEKWERSDRIR